MTRQERVLLAVAIVALDLVVFVLPLAALFLAWVLIARPAWAREAFETLYRDEPGER